MIQSCKNFRFACCFHNGWLYLPSVKATEIHNLSCWLDILDLPLLSIWSDIFADTKLVHVLALHNSFSFLLSLVWQTIFYLAVIALITFHHYILVGHDLNLLSLLRISYCISKNAQRLLNCCKVLFWLDLIGLNIHPLLFALSPNSKMILNIKIRSKLAKFWYFYQLRLSFFIFGDKNR